MDTGHERERDSGLETGSSEPFRSTPRAPISEVRLRGGSIAACALTDPLRAELWAIVHAFLFGPTARSSVARVWSAPPISGMSDRIPADVIDILERWFSLVEPADVYAFVETVRDNLETPSQHSFATACSAALDYFASDPAILAASPSRSGP